MPAGMVVVFEFEPLTIVKLAGLLRIAAAQTTSAV